MHESTETENQNKKREPKEVQRDVSHELPDWLQEFMENLVDESTSEELRRGVQTLPSHPMNFQWSREQKWNWVRVSTVYVRTFRRIQIVISAVVPRAEHFGDLTKADHKVLSEESESRNNHRYVVVVQDLATQWLQSYPCTTKIPWKPRRT